MLCTCNSHIARTAIAVLRSGFSIPSYCQDITMPFIHYYAILLFCNSLSILKFRWKDLLYGGVLLLLKHFYFVLRNNLSSFAVFKCLFLYKCICVFKNQLKVYCRCFWMSLACFLQGSHNHFYPCCLYHSWMGLWVICFELHFRYVKITLYKTHRNICSFPISCSPAVIFSGKLWLALLSGHHPIRASTMHCSSMLLTWLTSAPLLLSQQLNSVAPSQW